MKGPRVTVTTLIVAMAFHFVPLSSFAEDARGPAGLPPYVKSPSDRPPPAGIEPEIVPQNLTADGILAKIPKEDSVIIIGGKVNMGGKEYYSVYPKFRGGSLYGALRACKKKYMMRPQFKAAESEGYNMFVIVKDTATDPDCWNQFRYLETVDLSCDRLMVKTTENAEPAAWDNPDSTYANSYDLRTFPIGPVISKEQGGGG
jgi:hypothetical protein